MSQGNQPQVYSRHLTNKKTSEHLSRFNDLLSQMMSSAEGKPGAIGDITVVELSQANFAGVIAGSMLGELGARVIKVEPPEGDPAREITPYGANLGGVGIPYLMESRNKRNITIDIESEVGREDLGKLLSRVDVVIDTLRPGQLDELGIGYRQLREKNPGLVYVGVSPYGHYTEQARELANIPDSDLTAQADAGYPFLTGDPEAPEPYNYPVRAGIWAAWYMAGTLAVAGTLTALIHKRKTGEGQMVDVATHDAISVWQGFSLVWGSTFEKPRARVGNFDWCLFPYGYYASKDGYVTVAAGQDADFRGFLRILGRWDLENDWRYLYDRITDDVEKLKGLEVEFKKEFAKHTSKELVNKTLEFSAKAAKDRLRGRGFPIAVETLRPRQVLEQEHWQVRRSFIEIDEAKVGKFMIPTAVPRMSATPPRVDKVGVEIGEANREVYREYGLSGVPEKKGIEAVEA